MVPVDPIYALRIALAKERMQIQTTPEICLNLEGLLYMVDSNPPYLYPETAKNHGLYRTMVTNGMVPLIFRQVNDKSQLVIGLLAQKLITAAPEEKFETLDPEVIMVNVDDTLKLLSLPPHHHEQYQFVLLTYDDYHKITSKNLVFDKAERRRFLQGIDPDTSAAESVLAAILFAIAHHASDIHIEPDPGMKTESNPLNWGRIRFRIDGVLITKNYILTEKNIARIVSYIKIASNLDITEHQLPQDGRYSFREEDIKVKPELKNYELRVSTMPTVHGVDSVVLRLLKKNVISLELKDLGFSESALERLKKQISIPDGIIPVTGPTGSGKTTTLYAMLSFLNDGTKKIITAEDPVERRIPGLVQTQINYDTGLTFPIQLRSTMRHDPDIILVGEIRDAETAQTSIQASVTGHLVFTTIHVNRPTDVIQRLVGLGVVPAYLASCLRAVISQRLIRQMCRYCSETYQGRDELTLLLGQDAGFDLELERAVRVKCQYCQGNGYSGRILLPECWYLNQDQRDLIAEGVSTTELETAAIAAGFEPMTFTALDYVLKCRTDVAEILRGAVSADDLMRHGAYLLPRLRKNQTKLEEV